MRCCDEAGIPMPSNFAHVNTSGYSVNIEDSCREVTQDAAQARTRWSSQAGHEAMQGLMIRQEKSPTGGPHRKVPGTATAGIARDSTFSRVSGDEV